MAPNKKLLKNMSIRPFPINPDNRKIVAVMDSFKVEKCTYEPNGHELLYHNEATILPYPLPDNNEEVSPALQYIIESGLAKDGAVLVQSPYNPDIYANEEDAYISFALEKKIHFSTVCGYLGATEVSIVGNDTQKTAIENELNIGGEYKGIGMTAQHSDKTEEDIMMHMNLHDIFEGGEPDIAAAEKHLKENNLWSDLSLRSLIDSRSKKNKIKTRTLVINFSRESRKNIELAISLNALVAKVNGISYKSDFSKTQNLALTFLVKF